MSARRDFLLRVFRTLEEEGVDYCVLRNFDEMLEAGGTDVDLLARPEDIARVCRSFDRAATALNWRLVQKTRFVNHSLVFWNGEEEFVRLDVDTEVRWRFLPVLDANDVLRERQRQGDFHIPSPEHEGAILLTQALWQGQLKPRYAQRLDELGQSADVEMFRRKTWDGALKHPLKVLQYAGTDLRRLATRFVSPCGIALQLVTVKGSDLDEVTRRLAVLFPPAKTSLFKGGIAPEIRRAPSDRELAKKIPAAKQSRRTFLCLEDSAGHAQMIHVGSGCMKKGALPDLAKFIPEILARDHENNRQTRPGLFVVLVGLDGAGKTTFSRNLCNLVAQSGRFRAAHYFHWIPRLTGQAEYPLPAFEEVARKRPAAPGLIAMAASLLRLSRNLLKAHLSYWLRVRPLRNRGAIVMVDRFVYNYWLDPVSVKYAAPLQWVPRILALFPRPDVLITLSADPETLLSRKRELSREEIAEQTRKLESMPKVSRLKIELDASMPAEKLARLAFEKLEQIAS